MARPLRVNVEGGWYHVYGRGTERRNLFNCDREREHFIELLEALVERYRIVIHAYALMTNHYHLILQVPDGNLSAAMHWFSTSYGVWFNIRNDRVGPLFQGRFGSVPIQDSAWSYETSLYLHLNPVMRKEFGLDPWSRKMEGQGWKTPTPEQVKRRLSELRRYPWSSYRAYAGYAGAPAWLTTQELLRRAARKKSERAAAYRRDVRYALTKGVSEPFAEQLKSGLALGSAKFVKRVKALANGADREISGKRELRRRVEFEDAVRAVEQIRGVSFEKFTGTRGDWGRPLLLWTARRYCGMTLKELGERMGGTDYGAVAMMIKRFEQKLPTSRELRKAVEDVKRRVLG